MGEMRICYSAASEIGQRESNQDNLRAGDAHPWADLQESFADTGVLTCGTHQLLGVCDGIGGGYMGDMAALLALEAIADLMAVPGAGERPLDQLVMDAAESAHEAVCEFLQRKGRSGGCTLTLLGLSADGKFSFLNIGDSPCFWQREDAPLRELSVRHNLFWHKCRMQIAPGPYDAGFLMRYLGKPDCSVALMAARVNGRVQPGDRFLLCTDGVTNHIGPEVLEEKIRRGADAQALVKEAAAAAGADNCTAILLKIDRQHEA